MTEMDESGAQWVVRTLRDRGLQLGERPDKFMPGWSFRCPGHDGETTLEITNNSRLGRWFITCNGGCHISEVTTALGLPTPVTSDGMPHRSLKARLLTRSQLAELPEPQPLIDGTIDRRTVAVVAGHFGTMKSFVLQDWAACVATGRDWMGRPVEQGKALYIAAEGAHGLDRRWSAWEYGWRRTIPADSLVVLPEPVNLLDATAVDELCAVVAGTTLVVVDTLARCLVGADENSAKDMGMAVDALYRIRNATGDGTVVVAHHTGKDKSTIRGSSALEAGVDTVYTTEGDPRSMRMTRTKRKDGPREDTLALRLNPVLESAVISSSLGVDIRPTAQELLSTFMSTFAATGASKADLRAAANMPPASFSRALNDLVSTGALANTGTDQRPFYKLPKDQ